MAPSAQTETALPRAFEAWCSHQRLAGRLRRGSSEAVYRAMWQALAAWCTSRKPVPRLASLHPGLLAEYLAGRSGRLLADGQLTPRYQARLLALVRRVQAHHQWRRLQTDAARAPDAGAPPPLLPAMHRAPMSALASDAALPEPPLHLLPDDAQRLVQWLCRCGPAWSSEPS